MNRRGLINPVIVSYRRIPATGFHRLEAARLLGWTEIEATIISGSDIELRLVELDENLARAELTAAERGEQMAEKARLEGAHERAEEAKREAVKTATKAAAAARRGEDAPLGDHE